MKTRCLLGLLTLIAATGCGHEEPYEKPLTPVGVQTVRVSSDAPGIRYSAGIEPRTRVDLAFKAGGYVNQLASVGGRTIQDGDGVRRGMVLARVRVSDYDEKVKQAQSQLREAEAALAQALPALERATRLFESRSLARPDLEQAQAAASSLQAKVDGARALVQEAENARADSALSSPIDGIVLKRLVEVGSLVGPGVGGFVLADTSSVRVVFGVPDTKLKTLRIGTRQAVSTEALPNRRFEGRITKIAPTADPRSRVFDVEITIPNPDRDLRVGMVAAVEISDATKATVASIPVVPLGAIIRSKDTPDGYAVYVVEERDGQAIVRLRTVVLGDMVGNQVTVVSGLRAGERIVVTGTTIVVDGERVSMTR